MPSDAKTTAATTDTRPPIELLYAAERLLRMNAERAAKGPWHAAPVWSPDSHNTSAVYSHAYPTGTEDSEVISSRSKRQGYGGCRNPHNAVYIATVDPLVGLAIADQLRAIAKVYGQDFNAAAADPHHPIGPTTLALARRILKEAD